MTRMSFAIAAALLALALPVQAQPKPDARVHAAAEARRAEAIDLLKEIVNIDSGTGDIAGNNRVLAVLTPHLTALGAQVRRVPAEAPDLPDNLVASLKGTGKGRVLLIAHVDTVFGPGVAAKRPFRIEGSRAYGPGVSDEKGGVVNAIMALKVLRDIGFQNFATLTLLLETSEERGSPGTQKLIKALASEHDVEFNLEPGDPPDNLTVWRKGSARIHIRVKGRPAHAGVAPQDGRNAALELIHQITSLAKDFPTTGDGTTVNLTVMKAGERTNIIPDAAEAIYSARYRQPKDLEQIVARFRAAAKITSVPDTSAEIYLDSGLPPLIQNDDVNALADRARAIYAELGKTIGASGNGGASESALAQAAGTPALDGLGWVGGDFHTDNEWVDLNSVTPRLYLLTRLIMDAGINPPKRR
jgi:glutamate carboxypeptidase